MDIKLAFNCTVERKWKWEVIIRCMEALSVVNDGIKIEENAVSIKGTCSSNKCSKIMQFTRQKNLTLKSEQHETQKSVRLWKESCCRQQE